MYIISTVLLAANEFWDTNIINLINGIAAEIPNSDLLSASKKIAGVLALLYFSFIAFKMLLGEEQFDVMKLARPFIIGLCIINFGTLVTILNLPENMGGSASKARFEASAKRLHEQAQVKDSLVRKIELSLFEKLNELQQKNIDKFSEDASIIDLGATVSQLMGNVTATITLYYQFANIRMSLWLQGMLNIIIIACFKATCYVIFFIQMILKYILIMLGPYSFAFSIAKPFSSSWSKWVTRYLSVSFYSIIAYAVLNIAFAILHYGHKQEIDRYQQMLSMQGSDQFWAAMLQISWISVYIIIALIVAFAGIISIPVASSWILGTAETGGSFFGGMMTGALNTAKTATGVATASASTLITKGKGISGSSSGRKAWK